MDGPNQTHSLSLKVMRISRPSLSSAWQPFFSSSPLFSAHSTASVLSLQGSTPLQGHPKTLRDLSHAGELLTLPSSFGAIQLGETFSSYLCVNNESRSDIIGATLKVEMQTALNKITLAESDNPNFRLASGDTMEMIVNHEIKEIGQHVLACTVSYHSPSYKDASRPIGGKDDPSIQTFRKFYKFMVTNPFSVKTKVHVPKSPTALMSKSEREKIFLEIHVQNLTQEPLWFERVFLEPLEGWTVDDGNIIKGESVFSGTAEIMHPQDMRQYIYILKPALDNKQTFPVQPVPGSVIPLGRLDIVWRSSFGEPGHLLTSVLSRRVPALQPPPPTSAPATASAIPPYLQRGSISGPARPRSPQTGPQRTNTPPPVPYVRRGSSSVARPQSPAPGSSMVSINSPTATTHSTNSRSDIDIDLVVKKVSNHSVRVYDLLTIDFTLAISATLSPPVVADQERKRKSRIIRLAVQHTVPLSPDTFIQSISSENELSSPGFSTPSSLADSPHIVTNYDLNSSSLTEKLLDASVQQQLNDIRNLNNDASEGQTDEQKLRRLKWPSMYTSNSLAVQGFEGEIVFNGSSLAVLEPIKLSTSADPDTLPNATADDSKETYSEVRTGTQLSSTVGTTSTQRGESIQDFSLNYLPKKKGFARVGGLRVLLIEDQFVDTEEAVPAQNKEKVEVKANENDITVDETTSPPKLPPLSEAEKEVRILREWDVIAEVLVL